MVFMISTPSKLQAYILENQVKTAMAAKKDDWCVLFGSGLYTVSLINLNFFSKGILT